MARFLVSGGGGFVGKAICQALKRRGDEVISIARGNYPELTNLGIKTIRADISQPLDPFYNEIGAIDAIFHTASKVDMWGHYQDFFKVNVIGTRHMLGAARALGAKHFIYTSSPSVIADGRDACGIDESKPYPRRHQAYYPATKAVAEREVLAANSNDAFRTVALRPHLIWGPGDRHLVPTILERAHAGRLIQIGDGKNLVDLSYIDDCVSAHLSALASLRKSSVAAGRAYFISQGEPVNLWDWVNQVLGIYGVPLVTRRISAKFASAIAAILETISRVRPGMPEPLLTRFLVSQMSTSHYFNISAAKRDLGYSPEFSIESGLRVLRELGSDDSRGYQYGLVKEGLA